METLGWAPWVRQTAKCGFGFDYGQGLNRAIWANAGHTRRSTHWDQNDEDALEVATQ